MNSKGSNNMNSKGSDNMNSKGSNNIKNNNNEEAERTRSIACTVSSVYFRHTP